MTVDELLDRLDRVSRSGSGWMARCPAHQDRRASLSIGVGADDRVLLKCFSGCEIADIVAALGIEMFDLFERGGGVGTPAASRATRQQSAARGCTIAAYAAAKGLDVGFLESLGVSEIRFQGQPAVRFPYLTEDGVERCVRYRV